MLGIKLILLGLTLFYVCFLAAVAWGFQKVKRQKRPKLTSFPHVSVLVPARNEAAQIEACIRSIMANTYPPDRFEVWVIDDVSEDETPQRVQNLQAEFPNLHLLHMPENAERTKAHKKRALEKGVLASNADFIMTTDADCVVKPQWIEKMAGCFTPETAFVSGGVAFRHNDHVFGDLQALEFLGLVAIGAGAIGIQQPNLANGANVAYRREVFLKLKGFEGIDHISSGDDDLLMQKIAATKHWQVKFCASPEALVMTNPMPRLYDFIQQRKRWASKGALYPNKAYVTLLSAIYLFYLALPLAMLFACFDPSIWAWIGLSGALKIGAEAAILVPACLHWGQGRLLPYFLPEQVLHLPYILFIGAAATFSGYEWKGRNVPH